MAKNPYGAYSHTSGVSGKTYFLHSRLQTIRGGQQVTLYYFAKIADWEHCISAVPPTHEVVENKKTGLPLLRKKRTTFIANPSGKVKTTLID